MVRACLLLTSFTLLVCLCPTASAQVVSELYNEQGASAPCIGIGAGILLVKKCVSAFEKAGFVRGKDLGATGLTLGEETSNDSVVTAVTPGSAAALAGIAVGDTILRVDEHPASPTPAEVLARRTFGERDQDIHLKIRRAQTEQDLQFKHQPKDPPPPPKGEGMMTSERPIINWRGQFAPCIGFGPGALIAYAICDKHFAPFGFVQLKEFSGPGFALDPATPTAATPTSATPTPATPNPIVRTVEPDSPAAKAGLQPGDAIIALEGKPLTGSAGENAKMLLFGKIGQAHQVEIRRGTEQKVLALTLAPAPPH